MSLQVPPIALEDETRMTSAEMLEAWPDMRQHILDAIEAYNATLDKLKASKRREIDLQSLVSKLCAARRAGNTSEALEILDRYIHDRYDHRHPRHKGAREAIHHAIEETFGRAMGPLGVLQVAAIRAARAARAEEKLPAGWGCNCYECDDSCTPDREEGEAIRPLHVIPDDAREIVETFYGAGQTDGINKWIDMLRESYAHVEITHLATATAINKHGDEADTIIVAVRIGDRKA